LKKEFKAEDEEYKMMKHISEAEQNQENFLFEQLQLESKQLEKRDEALAVAI